LGYAGAVQITGAFIAIHAEIVDQKLNVTGGVLDWISVPKVGSVDDAGNPIGGLFYLVTLMQAGPDDQQKPCRMKLELARHDQTVETLAEGEITFDGDTGENRFWVMPFVMQAERQGRMVLINSIEGGGFVSIPVDVRFS
ncbi:hypothetical protein, partial [Mycolicibacterium sp. CBMA 361]|uniref:hypothetical protein n=1 Tax=Mycolicibacterium sp. CBMA 361 TaxID=2606610 RepID=UPI00193EC181